jgi:hypothetical protein
MRISTVLGLIAVGVAAGYFITQTDKGNELRRNLADSAGDLGKRLGKLRRQGEDMLNDAIDDASSVAGKARQKADGQYA